MPAPPLNSNGRQLQAFRSHGPAAGLRRYAPLLIRRRGNGWQVHIYWKRFSLLLLASGLCAWVGLASAAYFFVK
jgi:hypothetical protein